MKHGRPGWWEDPPEDPPEDVDADAAEQYAEELRDDEPIEDRDCDYWNRVK